jgi:hypothetical protein
MMKGLDSLISRQRWLLEDKRRIASELERLAERLSQELKDLDRQAEDRPGLAVVEPGGEAPHRQQDAAAIARRATLHLSLVDVEEKVREARTDVARAIREMKKYDLAKARRERAKREQRRPTRPIRQTVGGRLEPRYQRRPENV